MQTLIKLQNAHNVGKLSCQLYTNSEFALIWAYTTLVYVTIAGYR